MFTRFPLKCVTVVGVDYVLRFNWKIIVVIARFIYYDHVVFKRKFAIVFVFYHFTKEIKLTPTSSRQATSALRWVFTEFPKQADEYKLPYPTIRNLSNAANESYSKDLHIRT